jgi:hypothetical protein
VVCSTGRLLLMHDRGDEPITKFIPIFMAHDYVSGNKNEHLKENILAPEATKNASEHLLLLWCLYRFNVLSVISIHKVDR